MGRPMTKTDLLLTAAEKYEKLNDLILGLSKQELATAFDFSKDVKKKEVHWQRDKNLRVQLRKGPRH